MIREADRKELGFFPKLGELPEAKSLRHLGRIYD